MKRVSSAFFNSLMLDSIALILFRARPYRCSDCPRKFLWKAFLKRHVRDLHSGVKAYSCDVCGESFHFAINAYMHKKKEHAEHVRKSTRLQKK